MSWQSKLEEHIDAIVDVINKNTITLKEKDAVFESAMVNLERTYKWVRRTYVRETEQEIEQMLQRIKYESSAQYFVDCREREKSRRKIISSVEQTR